MRIKTNNSQKTFRQLLRNAMVLPLVLAFALAAILLWQFKRTSEASLLVQHSEQVLNQTQDLQNHLLDLETGMRGFILTDEPRYLEPYINALPLLDPSILKLKNLVADNPKQTARIQSLIDNIQQWTHFAQSKIGQRHVTPLTSFQPDGTGIKIMDAIRAQITAIAEEENQLIKERSRDAAENTTLFYWTIFSLTMIVGAILVFLVRRQIYNLAAVYESALGDQSSRLEGRFRLLVEAVKDYAIFLLDVDGNIETWNEGARRLKLYEANEIIGKPFSTFFSPEDIASGLPEQQLKNAVTFNRFESEGWCRRKDGTQFWASVLITPLKDQNGALVGFSKVTRDLTERKKAEDDLRAANESLERRVLERTEQLAESEAQFRTFADGMPQLAWIARPDGFISWYNKRWYQFTGKTFAEIGGWNWEGVHDPAELQNVKRDWTKALADCKPIEMKVRLRRADGDFRWFLTLVTPIFNSKGTVARWIGTNTDITAELEAKEIAESANRIKSAFLANMSHEIRTPLGVMIGFADLISDPNLDPEERAQFAQTLKRNGEQLNHLINDILDLSKVEAGHLTVEAIRFSLRDMLENVMSTMNVKAHEKGLILSYRLVGQIDDQIVSDPTRLQQILYNVIGNAIKFTSKGEITLSVAQLNEELSIEIEDTGIGISEQHQAALFKPFHQADETITRKFGGTGLGLSLSKRLAKLLGGDLRLKESTVGRGSVFKLVIKNGVAADLGLHQQPTSKKTLKNQKVRLDGLSILLVEDSPDNQKLISLILSKSGATIELADNGIQGVQKALAGHHNLVLMDVQMPLLDGYSATQSLREAGFHTPIIALTAHAMSDVREKCLKVGFSDYLPKPIHSEALVDMIAKLALRVTTERRPDEKQADFAL